MTSSTSWCFSSPLSPRGLWKRPHISQSTALNEPCPCQQLPWLPLPSHNQAFVIDANPCHHSAAVGETDQHHHGHSTLPFASFPLHFSSLLVPAHDSIPSLTQGLFFISLALFSPCLPSSPTCPLPPHHTSGLFFFIPLLLPFLSIFFLSFYSLMVFLMPSLCLSFIAQLRCLLYYLLLSPNIF